MHLTFLYFSYQFNDRLETTATVGQNAGKFGHRGGFRSIKNSAAVSVNSIDILCQNSELLYLSVLLFN